MTTVMSQELTGLDAKTIASVILGKCHLPEDLIPKEAWAEVVGSIIKTVVMDSPGWMRKPQSIKRFLEEDGKVYSFRSFARSFTSSQVQSGLPKGVAPQEVYFEIAELGSLPINDDARRTYEMAVTEHPDAVKLPTAGYEKTFKVLLGRKGRLFVLRALWKPEWEDRGDMRDGEYHYHCRGVKLREVTPEELFSMPLVCRDASFLGKQMMLGFYKLAGEAHSVYRHRAEHAARKLERMRAIATSAGIQGLE